MNDKRDPLLEDLFSQSRQQPVNNGFTQGVMSLVEKRRKNVIVTRVLILLAIVALEILLSSPLQNSVGSFTEALSTSLIEVENEWLEILFAPINSIAGLVGILLLGIHHLYRRMVR